MKIKISKLTQLGSALVLSLSTLLTLSIPLAHAVTSTCTWTDASGQDNNFSTAGNWNCGGTKPGNGDTYNLVFPGSAAGFNPVDDIASLTVGTITFSGTFSGLGYDITSSSPSNVMNIGGGITDNSSGSSNEVEANLTLSGNQAFSAGSGSQLIVGSGSDTINIGNHTLTLANTMIGDPIVGSGSLTVADSSYPTDTDGVDLGVSSPSFTGAVSVTQGALFVDDAGALSNASGVTVASGTLLKGSGGLSSATIQSGGTIAPGHSPGCITAANLTINGTYLAQLDGANACSDYDQLQVSNSVNVTGATLQLSLLSGFTPTAGETFEIINNSGSNPVTGTFSGLAEGATLTSGGTTFQISYVGGDGNDVVLTVTKAATSPAAAGTTPAAPDTGLAASLAHPVPVFLSSVLAASMLLVLARRLKSARS